MKKITLIGLFGVIVAACLLSYWQNVKTSKFDKIFREDLPGTWSSELDNMRLTNAVMIDGSFASQLIFIHPGRTNTYQETGTWIIKNGNIIETVKGLTKLGQ